MAEESAEAVVVKRAAERRKERRAEELEKTDRQTPKGKANRELQSKDHARPGKSGKQAAARTWIHPQGLLEFLKFSLRDVGRTVR